MTSFMNNMICITDNRAEWYGKRGIEKLLALWDREEAERLNRRTSEIPPRESEAGINPCPPASPAIKESDDEQVCVYSKKNPDQVRVMRHGGMRISVALKYIFEYLRAGHMELRQYR